MAFSAVALMAALFVASLGPYRYAVAETDARGTPVHLQPAESS